jgi:entericidin B
MTTIVARRILAALMLLGVFGVLGAAAGCNTVAGAGKDIESGGEAVHDSARDVQKKM